MCATMLGVQHAVHKIIITYDYMRNSHWSAAVAAAAPTFDRSMRANSFYGWN